MALTRNFLKGLNLTEEQIGAIIEAHTDTVDGLKAYKADAEKLATVQAELDALKSSSGGYEKKYNDEHAAFEAYKADVAKEKTNAAKVQAYRSLLSAAGIADKRIDSIVRVTDLSGIEVENGTVKGADALTAKIKTEWAEFIPASGTDGAHTPNPPAGQQTDIDNMSDADYYKMIYEKK